MTTLWAHATRPEDRATSRPAGLDPGADGRADHAGPDLDAPRLRVRTVALAAPESLLALLPTSDAVAWLRDGEGMVGWGEVVRHEAATAAEAARWWRRLVASAHEESDLDPAPPGSGLVAFGSFPFDEGSTHASGGLVVPRTVVGRRDGQVWLTEIAAGLDVGRLPPAATPPPEPPRGVRWADGPLGAEGWQAAVARAVDEIGAGHLAKVVLAREVVAGAEAPLDLRWLVARLAEGYPRCWTYLVDGLVGATPEVLVSLRDGRASSRVLAGTVERSGDDRVDRARAAALSRSPKDLAEHAFAVASVSAALTRTCSGVSVPDAPFVLELPNVLHLASDLEADVAPGATALDLVAALHPSAAVCGTPTAVARDLIAELEHVDRERYSGPVGWIDAGGAGEWGIALRCGILDGTDPRRIRLFAGCGIVAGSDPGSEWAESRAKLAPMIDALGARGGASPAPAVPSPRSDARTLP